MIGLTLVTICSVAGVHPRTTQQIIEIESKGDELAFFVNGEGGGQRRSKDKAEAIHLAAKLIGKGRSIALGLMQINSKNLKRLGLTAEDAFDPCKNIKAGTQILKENYDRAEAELGPGQEALKAAVSAYNSGNFNSGRESGYVAKFYRRKKGPPKPEAADITVSFDYEGDSNGFGSSKDQFEKKGIH